MRSKAHTPEIEMLQASLSSPFIFPENPGTASGEGGSRDGYGKAAREKTHSHREAGIDLPTLLQLLVVKSSLLHLRSFYSPAAPATLGSAVTSFLSSSAAAFLPPSRAGTHSLQLVARALEQRSHDALLASIFTVLCKRQQLGARLALLPLLREAEMQRCGEEGTGEGRNAGTGRSFVPPWCTSLFRWRISFTLEASILILQLRLSL